ncbi:hypothetical protein VNI00_011527 [Paramarasmius palmivorus]|uniref:Uncharacterized protein n=1 Tax=Paramarasmius palmivorus TaxID=297713 RepID=A0AAW0CEW9_9AGAR
MVCQSRHTAIQNYLKHLKATQSRYLSKTDGSEEKGEKYASYTPVFNGKIHPAQRESHISDQQAGTMEIASTKALNGHSWHITDKPDETTSEEKVFTIQGIVYRCDLPPVTTAYGKSISPKHVQQRVVLTGLNTATFTAAVDGLAQIVKALRANIRDYQPFETSTTTEGYQTIDIANRYFTSKRFAKEQDHIRIPTHIDPKGILNDMRGDTFVHTIDNTVEYYRMITTSNSRSFKNISPSLIKDGDIVEIQLTVSLIEFNVGKGRNTNLHHITKLTLRSITLLDETYSLSGRSSTYDQRDSRPTLKRRIGYAEEEEQDARQRMKKMNIDEQPV